MPLVAWRLSKRQHDPYDGTGALLRGARWNSPGHLVIYAADTFAGAILEILGHAARPRTLPGAHHAVRIEIPDTAIETLDPATVLDWDSKGSPEARRYGDRWLEEARTPVLVVPSLPSRPIGRTVLINPQHAGATAITVGVRFEVPWDERLF